MSYEDNLNLILVESADDGVCERQPSLDRFDEVVERLVGRLELALEPVEVVGVDIMLAIVARNVHCELLGGFRLACMP